MLKLETQQTVRFIRLAENMKSQIERDNKSTLSYLNNLFDIHTGYV